MEGKDEFFFTNEQREQLIDFVKARPELYAAAHPKFSDRDKRDRAWVEIGDILGKDRKFLLVKLIG